MLASTPISPVWYLATLVWLWSIFGFRRLYKSCLSCVSSALPSVAAEVLRHTCEKDGRGEKWNRKRQTLQRLAHWDELKQVYINYVRKMNGILCFAWGNGWGNNVLCLQAGNCVKRGRLYPLQFTDDGELRLIPGTKHNNRENVEFLIPLGLYVHFN